MTSSDIPDDTQMELRKKAELIYKADPGELSLLDQRQIDKIFQELQIHQIELEMQNDELRKTQIELESMRMRYTRLYQNAPAGYVVLDEAGLIVEANATFLRMTEWRTGGINGTPFAALLTTGDETVFRARYKSLFRNPGGKTLEVAFGRGMTVTFYAQLEAAPQLTGDMHRTGADHDELLITVTDVTARRRAEEERQQLELQLLQVQRMEGIGTLASGIAHDFNNILNVIMGNASLIEGRPEDIEKVRKRALSILKATERGSQVVKQLLTFARKSDIQLRTTEINTLIREISKLTEETFPKTISIRLDLDPTLTPVDADANQLHQVLLNLSVNARDAMPMGGEFSITTRRVPVTDLAAKHPGSPLKQYIEIRVKDTGAGMDSATQKRIFDPFFTTKGVGKGTGLGLSVAQGIIERHNGFIDVSSNPGKGTEFCIYLPLSTDQHAPADESIADPESASGGTETLLLIEDEEMIRETAVEVLEKKGYTVLSAVNGEEGVEVFRTNREKIRLVLSDYGLPKISGEEAFYRIRQLDAHVPFMLLTGFIDPEKKKMLIGQGMHAVIHKPYKLLDVLKKIRETLDETRPPSGQR